MSYTVPPKLSTPPFDQKEPPRFITDGTELPQYLHNSHTNREDIMISKAEQHYEAHYDPEHNQSTFVLDFPGQDLQGFTVGLEPANNGDVLVHIANESEGDTYRFKYNSIPHTPVDAHNPPHIEWKYGRLTIVARHLKTNPELAFWPIS